MSDYKVDDSKDKEDITLDEGVCPYCQGTSLEYGVLDVEESSAFYDVTCVTCGNSYREYYRLEFDGQWGYPLKKKQSVTEMSDEDVKKMLKSNLPDARINMKEEQFEGETVVAIYHEGGPFGYVFEVEELDYDNGYGNSDDYNCYTLEAAYYVLLKKDFDKIK